jgi:hypothetical protein
VGGTSDRRERRVFCFAFLKGKQARRANNFEEKIKIMASGEPGVAPFGVVSRAFAKQMTV